MPESLGTGRKPSCAVSAWLILAIWSAIARGGVVNLHSQDRFVDVTTSGSPLPGLPMADQHFAASNFSPFNQTANLNYTPVAVQSASQNSTLTLTPDGAKFDASGSLFGSISFNGLDATTHFHVNFDLTQPEPYLLTYNGEQGDPRPTSPKVFVPGLFTGPSAPGTLAGDPHTTNYFTVLTYSGTLEPGNYDLVSEIHTTGFGSFDVHLAIGTAAVPLPSALWQTLVWMPVLLGGLWLFHRAPRTASRAVRFLGTCATRS